MNWFSQTFRIAGLCFGLLVATAPTDAQQTGREPEQARNDWSTQCVSEGRDAPADCALEQRLIVKESIDSLGIRIGDLLGSVQIRVPAATRQPTMLLQLPQNLFLPAGAILQVDEGEQSKVELQTCDASGCYASLAVSEHLLDLLRKGDRLRLGIQNMSGNKIEIIVPLGGFTAGFQKIE